MKDSPAFKERCANHAASAETDLGRRLNQLKLRRQQFAAANPERAAVAQEEHTTEEALAEGLLAAIKNPAIRLDSVGFIVVSGRRPPQGEADDDD